MKPASSKEMFGWFRAADPGAVPYVNDFGILSGNDAAPYIAHIRELLGQGVPVGGIGCQGHFGGAVDPFRVRSVLDRLALFNLPIKVTEFDMDTRTSSPRCSRRTCASASRSSGSIWTWTRRGGRRRTRSGAWTRGSPFTLLL